MVSAAGPSGEWIRPGYFERPRLTGWRECRRLEPQGVFLLGERWRASTAAISARSIAASREAPLRRRRHGEAGRHGDGARPCGWRAGLEPDWSAVGGDMSGPRPPPKVETRKLCACPRLTPHCTKPSPPPPPWDRLHAAARPSADRERVFVRRSLLHPQEAGVVPDGMAWTCGGRGRGALDGRSHRRGADDGLSRLQIAVLSAPDLPVIWRDGQV